MIEISIIVLIILVLSIAGGILSINKYKKTKDKKWLIIGLILTLIVIGLIFYIYSAAMTSMVAYGPAPP